MESWLIPAAPVTVVEEIKKSRFITLLAHTDGVAAAKALSSPSERITLMPATTAWRGSRGRLMIRNSWGFQTMANRRERRVNRCWRS